MGYVPKEEIGILKMSMLTMTYMTYMLLSVYSLVVWCVLYSRRVDLFTIALFSICCVVCKISCFVTTGLEGKADGNGNVVDCLLLMLVISGVAIASSVLICTV